MNKIERFIKTHNLSGGEAAIARRLLSNGADELVVRSTLLDMGSDEMRSSSVLELTNFAKQRENITTALKERGHLPDLVSKGERTSKILKKAASRLIPESQK